MVQRSNIRRVRVAVESAIGVDGTGTINNFKDLRIKTLTAPRETQAFIADASVRSRRVLSKESQLGWKRGSLALGGQLVSTGVELNAAASPTQDNLSTLLANILGGRTVAAGSLVASGASATGVTVTSTQGSRFPEGVFSVVETAVGSGLYVATGVDTRATDAIGFTHSVGFTPAVGAKVLNAEVLYESDQPTATLQFLVEGEQGGGAARDDIFLYRGCQGDLGITWPLGGELDWSSTQQFAGWLHDDELATPQGGSAMTQYTLAGSPPIVARAGHVVVTPAAGTTRTTPSTLVELTFNPGISRVMHESFNALVEGVAGYEMVSGQPMVGVTLARSEAAEIYKDAMEAKTMYRVFAQAGNVAGRIIILHCPTVQWTGMAPADRGGLDYVTLTGMCLPDNGLTNQATDLLAASYRIGRA